MTVIKTVCVQRESQDGWQETYKDDTPSFWGSTLFTNLGERLSSVQDIDHVGIVKLTCFK